MMALSLDAHHPQGRVWSLAKKLLRAHGSNLSSLVSPSCALSVNTRETEAGKNAEP